MQIPSDQSASFLLPRVLLLPSRFITTFQVSQVCPLLHHCKILPRHLRRMGPIMVMSKTSGIPLALKVGDGKMNSNRSLRTYRFASISALKVEILEPVYVPECQSPKVEWTVCNYSCQEFKDIHQND